MKESCPFLFTTNSSVAHVPRCVVSMLGMTSSMRTPLAGVDRVPGQSHPFMFVPVMGIMTHSSWQPPVLLDPFTDRNPSGNVYAVGKKYAPAWLAVYTPMHHVIHMQSSSEGHLRYLRSEAVGEQLV